MKIYFVSFPADLPVLERIREKGKNEILVSYFFIQQEKNIRSLWKTLRKRKIKTKGE